MKPIITAFARVPPFARALVRNRCLRRAPEKVRRFYDVRSLTKDAQKTAVHRLYLIGESA